MLVRALYAAAVAAGLIAAAIGLSAATGWPRWVWLLSAVALGFVALVWLPRAAHRAFRRGRYLRAEVLYITLRWLRWSRATRSSIDVSIAACALGRCAWDRALAVLDRVSRDHLGDAARAAWLNNRAYALARAVGEGRSGADADEALAASAEALGLRPDVVGFRHTRGVALLAAGRIDDAIRELDRLWGELAGLDAPQLEAERCYDLGVAWQAKGEGEYATDYFERARRAAPESRWAGLAIERLSRAGATTPRLDPMLETAPPDD